MEVHGKRIESDMDDKSTGVEEFCKPCGIIDKVKTKANGKCAQCEEHMCITCFRDHLRGKQCRNHSLLDINGTPVSVDKGKENEKKCEKHGEVVRFFCRIHDIVGCGDCAAIEHSRCKHEYIKDASKGFKDDEKFRRLSRKVEQLRSTSLDNDEKVQTYRKKCKVIHEDALKEIQNFRVDFNKYLDKAEADINTEAAHLKKTDDTLLDNLKQDSEQLSLKIDNLNQKLNVQLLPENELFINAVNSKRVVQQIEQGVAMVQTRSKIKEYKFVPDEQLLEILTSARKFGYLKMFEDIKEKEEAELKEFDVRLQPFLRYKLSKQVMDFFLFSFAFLVLHFLQSEAAGNEPVCSKFSYEEQLLGKITRVEVQMEEWDKHLKTFEETVLSVLGHRREEMENIVKKQNKKIEKQSEEYGKRQDAQNKKLEEMSLEQNKLWDELERRYTPIVAFNAYSTRGGIYPANKILNFANVLLNEGDGYNATSGYFTAPITGLYQFTAHVCSNPKCYFVYAIVHEDTTFALSTIHEDKYSTCASVGGMVEMKAGERVCVKSKLDDSDLLINAYRRPSFMGVLLRRKI